MGRRPHPVTKAILDAVALLERNKFDVTPEAIAANVEIGWKDWPPEAALREALRARIVRVLRSNGYVISEPEEHVRKDFWRTNRDELAKQLEIKRENSEYDRARIAVDEAVLSFLGEKERELGYEVYPGLFHGDIERIYAMHSVTPPANGVAA